MVGFRHTPKVEIHLESPFKDLLLIQGSPYDPWSFQLRGTVQIKAYDTLSARQLKLRLLGVHKIDFHHMVQGEARSSMAAVREQTTVLECCWDNLLTSPEGRIKIQYPHNNNTNESIGSDSEYSASISSTPSSHGSSSSSISLLSIPARYPHVIPHGTHSFPFQITLPGDITETVEGLPYGSVHFYLEATMERPSSAFKSNIVKQKYLRILRTLGHYQDLSMSDPVSIESTCPEKLQYKLSIPSGTAAIGSATPLEVLLAPLTKGLVLDVIRAQVVQQHLVRSTRPNGDSFHDSQVIAVSTMNALRGTTLMDSTRIEFEIKIPNDLKSCTPDCDLPNGIVRVRHRIRLQISLKNPDGQMSELTTHIPITLFLSPHHTAHAPRVEMLDKHGKVYFSRQSDVLFPNGTGTSSTREWNTDNNETLPSYESHVHDQLFTPFGSPSMGSTNNIDYRSSNTSFQSLTPQAHASPLEDQLDQLSFERMSQAPSYEEAVHPEASTSAGLELVPEYEHDDHYQLGDLQGLTITTSRSRRA